MVRLAFPPMIRRLFTRPPSPPRPIQSSGFRQLDPAQKVEEENLPWYSPSKFYPVRIGQVFASRYQAIGKLGYGGIATVWLCRDLQYVDDGNPVLPLPWHCTSASHGGDQKAMGLSVQIVY